MVVTAGGTGFVQLKTPEGFGGQITVNPQAGEQLPTVGPLLIVMVQLGFALKVAVTTLGVASALRRTPVNTVGLVKGAATESGPPPGGVYL